MSIFLPRNRWRVINQRRQEPSGTARRPRAWAAVGFVGLMSTTLLLSACGSSGATAAQQVCSDRAQVNGAVSTVISDVRSGDPSKAKDDLSAVTDSFDELKSSVQKLGSEQSQSLEPQIDKLKKTVSSLQGSSSLSDLVNGIDSAWNQAKSISRQIGDSLKCS